MDDMSSENVDSQNSNEMSQEDIDDDNKEDADEEYQKNSHEDFEDSEYNGMSEITENNESYETNESIEVFEDDQSIEEMVDADSSLLNMPMAIDQLHFISEPGIIDKLERVHDKNYILKDYYTGMKTDNVYVTRLNSLKLKEANNAYFLRAEKSFELIHPALAKVAFCLRDKQCVFYELPSGFRYDKKIERERKKANKFLHLDPFQKQAILLGVSTAIYYLYLHGYVIPDFSLCNVILVDNLPYIVGYVNSTKLKYDPALQNYRNDIEEFEISRKLTYVLGEIISGHQIDQNTKFPPEQILPKLSAYLTQNMNSDRSDFIKLKEFADFFNAYLYFSTMADNTYVNYYSIYSEIVKKADYMDYSCFLRYHSDLFNMLKKVKYGLQKSQDEFSKELNELLKNSLNSYLFGSLNNIPLFLSHFKDVFKEPFLFPFLNRVPEYVIKNLIRLRPKSQKEMYEMVCFEPGYSMGLDKKDHRCTSIISTPEDQYNYYQTMMNQAKQQMISKKFKASLKFFDPNDEISRIRPFHHLDHDEISRIRPFHAIALQFLKAAAKSGHKEAVITLAKHYIRGEIVPMNIEKAITLLAKYENDKLAQAYLKKASQVKEDIEKKIEEFNEKKKELYQQANNGHILSIVLCAYSFFTGLNDFPISRWKAIALYRKAAKLSPDYMCLLGGFYLRGWIFPKNLKRAQNCFRKAALGNIDKEADPSKPTSNGCFKAKIIDGMLRKHIWRLYLSDISVRQVYEQYTQCPTSLSFDDSMIFPTAAFLAESTQIPTLYKSPRMSSYFYYDTRNNYNTFEKNELKLALYSSEYYKEQLRDHNEQVKNIAYIIGELIKSNILPTNFTTKLLREENDKIKDKVDEELEKYEKDHPFENDDDDDVIQVDSIAAKKIKNARKVNLQKLNIVSDPTDKIPSETADKQQFTISYFPDIIIPESDDSSSSLVNKLKKLVDIELFEHILSPKTNKNPSLLDFVNAISMSENPAISKLERTKSLIRTLSKSFSTNSFGKLTPSPSTGNLMQSPDQNATDKMEKNRNDIQEIVEQEMHLFGQLNSALDLFSLIDNDNELWDNERSHFSLKDNDQLYSTKICISEEITKAEQSDDPDLYLKIANCYYNGLDGYPVNYHEAALFYKKAADKGNSEAQWKFAQMSVNGLGTIQDSSIANEYFSKSSQQEDSEGMLRYALFIRHILLNSRTSPSFPLPPFQELIEKSAAKGNIEALHQIGLSLESNYSRSDGIVRSIPIFLEAAEKGHIPSLIRLIQATDSYLKTISPQKQDEAASQGNKDSTSLYKQYQDIYIKYLTYAVALCDNDITFRFINFKSHESEKNVAKIIKTGMIFEPNLYIPYLAERYEQECYQDMVKNYKEALAILRPVLISYSKYLDEDFDIPNEHMEIITKGYIEKYVMAFVSILSKNNKSEEAVDCLVKFKDCLTIKSKNEFLAFYQKMNRQITRDNGISISFYLHEYRECIDAFRRIKTNKRKEIIMGVGKLRNILDQNENNQFALLKLGKLYYKGKLLSVIRNVPKALDYIQKAAQQDCPEARVTYGKILYYGMSGEQNIAKAFKYFSKAFEEGNRDPRSGYYLSKKAFRNPPYNITPQQADEYLNIACDFRYRRALFKKGKILFDQNLYDKAGPYLAEAKKQGYKKAAKFIKHYKRYFPNIQDTAPQTNKVRKDSLGEDEDELFSMPIF